MIKQSEDNKNKLHVGWDSEFQGTKIISHQLYIHETGTEIFIDFIKEDREAITWNELMGRIIEAQPDVESIILVSHFSRAEFASLGDGRETVLGSGMTYSSKTFSGRVPDVRGVKIRLVDTIKLFTKGLDKVGDAINTQKIDISPYRKDKMLELYHGDYDLFRRYAMLDAIIAVNAYLKTVALVEAEGMTIANTIGGIGERHLHKILKNSNPAQLKGLGYEIKQSKDKKGVRHPKVTVNSVIEERFERAMHGGRNETYIRGIEKDGIMQDYDLVSAYTTMQAVTPTWDTTAAKHFIDARKCYEYAAANPLAHGVVSIDYIEHRQGINFPIVALKNDDSLVFVSSSHNCHLSLKEFVVAYHDIEALRGFHAIVYPALSEQSIVSEFMAHIRDRRSHYKKVKDKFGDSVLKDIGNSTYGKFTQGYADKIGIDLKNSTKNHIVSTPVPPSLISNPMISTWVTGGIRALAYEILNELHRIGCRVFYWTTDGFVTDRDVPEYILNGEFGLWSRYISERLFRMTGNRQILELKHMGKGWIGLKTRAYAMIDEVDSHAPLFSLTGIQVRLGSHNEKAAFLLSEVTSLTRFKDTRYNVSTLTSVRDWIVGEDFKNNTETKGFNFDWDFKRKPVKILEREGMVSFDTLPFKNEDEYLSHRNDYDDFKRGTRKDDKQIAVKNKLLTLEHYREFDDYRLSRGLKSSGISRVTKATPERFLANYLSTVRRMTLRKIASRLEISVKVVRNAINGKLTIDSPEKVRCLVTSWLERLLQKEGCALSEYKGTKYSQRAQIGLDFLDWLRTKQEEQPITTGLLSVPVILNRLVYTAVVLATIKTVYRSIETRYGQCRVVYA